MVQTKKVLVGDPRFHNDIVATNVYNESQLREFVQRQGANSDLRGAVDRLIAEGQSFDVSSGQVKYQGERSSNGLYQVRTADRVDRAK